MDRGRIEVQPSQVTGWGCSQIYHHKTLIVFDSLKRVKTSDKTWNVQTDRTIYQWKEPSKTKKGILSQKHQCGHIMSGIV